MAQYTRERTQLLDWIETNREVKAQANQNFTNTDYAFKLYNQAHPDYKLTLPTKPKFSAMYQPSELQKQGELLFFRRGRAGACFTPRFVSFKHFLRLKINGGQTRQNLLQPSGLLERRLCDKKNWQKPLKCLKMMPSSGSTNRPFGRSIFQPRDTFLVRNLTWRFPTRSTRRTFFFYLITNLFVAARFTNMR